MGGHGGLNILPQKRWNVYRHDNRAKVARDEAEHQRKLDFEEAERRRRALDLRVTALRARCGDRVEDAMKCEERAEKILSGGEAVRCYEEKGASGVEKEENDHSRKRHVMKKEPQGTISSDYQRHFNIFAEEERLFTEAQHRHNKYLAEVSHDFKSISDFDFVKKETDSSWYMRTRDRSQHTGFVGRGGAPTTMTSGLPAFQKSCSELYTVPRGAHDTVKENVGEQCESDRRRHRHHQHKRDKDHKRKSKTRHGHSSSCETSEKQKYRRRIAKDRLHRHARHRSDSSLEGETASRRVSKKQKKGLRSGVKVFKYDAL